MKKFTFIFPLKGLPYDMVVHMLSLKAVLQDCLVLFDSRQGQLIRVFVLSFSASLLSPMFIPASLGSLPSEVLAHNIMHQAIFSY